jgi:hypothetical protein
MRPPRPMASAHVRAIGWCEVTIRFVKRDTIKMPCIGGTAGRLNDWLPTYLVTPLGVWFAVRAPLEWHGLAPTQQFKPRLAAAISGSVPRQVRRHMGPSSRVTGRMLLDTREDRRGAELARRGTRPFRRGTKTRSRGAERSRCVPTRRIIVTWQVLRETLRLALVSQLCRRVPRLSDSVTRALRRVARRESRALRRSGPASRLVRRGSRPMSSFTRARSPVTQRVRGVTRHAFRVTWARSQGSLL